MHVVRELEGRMEKRLPIAIVVHLTLVQDPAPKEAELTYTENISVHGACVISSRSWNPDDVVEVTTLKDRIALRGRVVHCQKRSGGHYAVGLAFYGRQINWLKYRTTTVPAVAGS
jgi:hypothetical protein